MDARHIAPFDTCPAAKCAEKSRRLAWVSHLASGSNMAPFEVLYIDVTGLHAELRAAGIASEVTLFRPSDELLTSLMLVCMGELERRDEARQRASQPAGCNCYGEASNEECPVHGAQLQEREA